MNAIRENWLGRLQSQKHFRLGLLFSARMSGPVLSLAFSLIATRSLSIESHGIYGRSFSAIIILQAILEAGLTNSVVRFLAPAIQSADRQSVRAIVRASIQLKLYTVALLGLPLLAYTLAATLAQRYMPATSFGFLILSADALSIIWLIFLGGLGMSVFTWLDSVLVAHEDFGRIFFWVPTVGIIRLVLLAGLFHGTVVSHEHVLYAFMAGPWIAILLFFMIFPARFFLQRAGRATWRPWVAKLLQYNIWILFAAFMAICSDWMEMLIINHSEQAAIYNAARLPMQAFMIVLTTMSSFLMTRFSRLKQQQEFQELFRRIFRFLLPGAIMFVPGLVLIPWFILAFYGDEYRASLSVFYILYPGFVLRIYAAPFGIALFALDQPRLIAMESAVRMIGGLILVACGYYWFGITGAAWGSLLAQFPGWLFLGICYWRYFQGHGFPFQPA
ncbi:MAG: hypothetical protein KDK39_00830 [Leptospiraceae bacterium]|nr:hypothetical protein [Leptospiraceae bacterium]